jgi:predicted transcriptional regulator
LNLLWGEVSVKDRSKNDIAVEILKAAMKGSNKTHIVCEAKINFNIATRYLEMLKDKEFIILENGFFITTDKGKLFHEKAKELLL